MHNSREEKSPQAEAALGPAELKAVRKLLSTSSTTTTTNGDDARPATPAGLLHGVPSATRRRKSAPRIKSLFRFPSARTSDRNSAARGTLVRIASTWAFRVLARMGPRGRRPPVNKKPSFISSKSCHRIRLSAINGRNTPSPYPCILTGVFASVL